MPNPYPPGVELVPITHVLPRDAILNLPILSRIAEQYASIPPEPPPSLRVLQDLFFQAFFAEAKEESAQMLASVASILSRLPKERLDAPITHPALWEEPSLSDRDPVFEEAFDCAFKWLTRVVKWGWITKGKVNIPDGYDHAIPWWFIYSCIEMARVYFHTEPDSPDSLTRAKVFVRFDNDWDKWSRVVLRQYGLEEIQIYQARMARFRGESRDDFALRVTAEVLNSVLRQIAEAAQVQAQMLDFLGIQSDQREGLRGDLLVRSAELARRMLGRETGSKGGSSLHVHIRYATLLGFIHPSRPRPHIPDLPEI